MDNSDLAKEVVLHHLDVFGFKLAASSIMTHAAAGHVASATEAATQGAVVVALQPRPDFARGFGVEMAEAAPVSGALHYRPRPEAPWEALRTLHPAQTFRSGAGEAIVVGSDERVAWLWVPVGTGGVLFVGTDLAGDLVRFRQGDPARAANRQKEALWGIAGERPLYLYEDQLAGLRPDARPADAWGMALVATLADKSGAKAAPILPAGAPGAVVITGDDDQAYLEKYAEQLEVLDGLPITYFLHPLTRHTPETLVSMLGRPGIEVEIHPDALDTPEAYGERLDEQVAWFRQLTGRAPGLVRNHGYLNDGYWGHLPHWRRHGIYGSSNLPGVDGRVLNGSLLPARMAFDGALTEHWSLLTAVGDGVKFIYDLTDAEAGQKVHDVGRAIEASGIPGVLCLNLHPQNIGETRGMHLAVRDLVAGGFQAWNLGQCLDWFSNRPEPTIPAARPGLMRRALSWLSSRPEK